MAITQVTGKFTAMVDGKSTGLAGCANTSSCPNAQRCLRSDAQLAMRVQHLHDGRCGSFIKSDEVAA